VHVDREGFNTSADVERWASGIPVPTYALDDQSALKVTDGHVEVVSEGNWRLFGPIPL
jgi:dipeptidase E